MKILVTGSSGFIGKHLVKVLSKDGHEIVLFDAKEHQFIDDIRLLTAAMQDCDSVIHLAAVVVHQTEFEQSMGDNLWVNISGFIRVIRLAQALGIKLFMYASSSAVYGRYGHKNGPFKESQPLDYQAEENHYGKTKMMNEMVAASYHDAFGMTTIGLRIMNAYGPGEFAKGDAGCAVAHLIKQKLDGHPLTIFGDGNQAKDYIYVTDCARMIADLLIAGNGVYNVGTGIATNFNLIARYIGGPVEYVLNPHKYYPLFNEANMTKTWSVIGKRPLVSLEDGIARTIQFYSEREAGGNGVIPEHLHSVQ